MKGGFPTSNIHDARRVVEAQRDIVLASLFEELHRTGQLFPRHRRGSFIEPIVVTVDPETACPDAPEVIEQVCDIQEDMDPFGTTEELVAVPIEN